MNYIYQKLFILFSIILMITIGGVGGYWLGIKQNQVTSQHIISRDQGQPSPTIATVTAIANVPSNTPIPTPLVNKTAFQMPTDGIVVETCSYPWDYSAPTPTPIDMECLEFEADGTVRKRFIDGHSSASVILAVNNNVSVEQKASISASLRETYQELTSDKYVEWLKKPKLPIVGSINSHIKLYSGDLWKQYTITVYSWGIDHSVESQRLQEIFDQLQSLSPLTDNRR